MRISWDKCFLLVLSVFCLLSVWSCKEGGQKREDGEQCLAAKSVLERTIGAEKLNNFRFILNSEKVGNDYYTVGKNGGLIVVEGNSPVALCRGAYHYLKSYCNSIVTWSGKRIEMPEELPEPAINVKSPYKYRYYFNVVTHGYSTAYWDWQRWEREIDWMALHGINMPLIPGAHEAILKRVWLKLGLTQEEIGKYFSGPAHFPWNRMGNLNGFDGPFPESFYEKQLQLTHKILDRMKELGMKPIVHAFAGFVPEGIKRVYSHEEIRELKWGGGLSQEYNAYILSPKSELFAQIGKQFIEEWEEEFGKGQFYLADSFNEMDVPLKGDEEQARTELAAYGNAVYQSIKRGNPDAVWVMQGWTFPFHRDSHGKLFWTPERLKALLSKVPDDKLLILDLANEYNHVFWKIDPSWKMYHGFWGKQWVYSFIPNMGGKVPLNGCLDVYASIPIKALQYPEKGNLVGFGFAPEGVENNEVIYELLSDMAWRTEEIELDSWIEDYCIQRYGAFPDELKKAYELLTKSALGTFTDHPMHRYQLQPFMKPNGVERKATVHTSNVFKEAVKLFLACSAQLGNNELYLYDSVELTAQYLGLIADQKLTSFLEQEDSDNKELLDEALEILATVDKLLASHPNHNLKKWVKFARNWGNSKEESDYYEANAKRLITTWGGKYVNDYSGRVWSGLIGSYYIPRWQKYHSDNSDLRKENLLKWEEEWIWTPNNYAIEPYKDPLKVAREMLETYSSIDLDVR